MKDRKTSHARTQEELESLRAQVAELEQERAARADAEREHRQTEQRLRLLSSAVEQSSAGIGVADLQGNLLFVNNAMAAMHGYSPQEVVGQHLSVFHTPEQMPAVKAARRQVEETGEFSGEIWHARRDGSTFPTLMHNSLLRGPSGEPAGTVATMRDVTERKQAEQELRASESLRRTAINATKEAMIAIDQQGLITVFNPAAEQMFGRRRKEMIGQPLDCLMPEQYRQPHREHVGGYFATGKPDRALGKILELPGLRSDGTEFPMEISLASGRHDDEHFVIAVARDISERKRAQQELRASEERYRSLVENIDLGIALISTDHEILMTNEMQGRLFNEPVGELVGKHCYAALRKCDSICPDCPGSRALETGRPTETEIQDVCADGSHLWMRIQAFPTLGADGTPTGFIEVSEDITERKLAQQRLQESQQMLQLVLDNIPQRIFWKDCDSVYRGGNRNFADDAGVEDLKDIEGKTDYDLPWKKEEAESFRARDRQVMETGRPQFRLVESVRQAGGREALVETTKVPLRDPDGKVVGILGTYEDITERTRAEKELQESKQMLQLVLDNIPQRIFWKDRDSVYRGCNRNVADDAGLEDPKDIVGKTDYDLPWKKEEADFYRQCDRRIMDADAPEYHIIEPELRADGTQAWLETNKVPLHDAAGNVVGILGAYEDITERTRAEKELQESKQMLQLVLDNVPQRIFWKNRDSVYRGCNRRFADDAGVENPKDVEGKTDYGLPWKKEEADFYRQCDRRIMDADAPEYHIIEPELRADGTQAWVETNKVPLHDAAGNVVGILGTYQDITEKRNLEEQLRQAQKMESIGTLTSGIAHDFNNLLTVIMGNASFLLNKLDRDSALYRPLQDVAKAGERAGSLIQQLLAFSRKTVLQMRPIDLRRCVDDTRSLLRPGIDPRIEIPPPRSDPSLWFVRADRGQMNQVIMNLCVNARDAMPAGGTLSIETKNTVIDEAYCRTNHQAQPGEYVELIITDTGTGMDRKTMDRMFDPFFTTKRPGVGTGLGLAMVDGIIGQHEGWITWTSKRRRGTSFHVFLPRAEEVPKETPARAPVQIPRGTETILLVDDEPLVLKVAKRILTGCGYHTVLAADGEEAVQMFQDYQQEIDLVVLDITLPKMDGYEVLAAIRNLDPNVKVILCSGQPASDTAPKTEKLAAGLPLLAKPMSTEALARTVRQVLDA